MNTVTDHFDIYSASARISALDAAGIDTENVKTIFCDNIAKMPAKRNWKAFVKALEKLEQK